MATFWLEPSPSGRAKLACVRQGYIDDRVVYQGFVGDWSRLKRELLAQIEGDFPEAELVPYSDDAPPQPQDSRLTMYTVPALLRVSDLPPLPTGDAWRSVAGMLLITWGAAIAVLVVAGLGFRNLVALTERRMQFAYAVTHELRTPLTTFRLYADMLSAGLVPQDKQSEYLDTLNRESLRLSRLVEGVLEYARLENHKVRLNLVEMSSASLLESIDETLSKPCEENEIEIRMDNLLAADKRLHTDISVIRQIAGVLINNACRHTRGAANPVVCVQLSGENGNVHLDVVDSGPGIDRSEARTIFKPFRRGREADAHAQGGIGLGLAMVRALARAGANLVIAGRRQGPIDAAANEVKDLGREALALSTDVTDSAQVDRLVAATLDQFGRLDVLINNAGAVQENVSKPIWDITDDEWKLVMDVNLTGAFYCARAVSQTMVDQGKGKIINVASGFGLRAGRDIYMYCCSKGGIIQLTRVLSFNLARHGVTANSIVPGYIPTASTEADIRGTLPRSGDFLPIGKLGRPEDLGPVAVFLASDASDYMTGEMIIADGGGLAGGIIPTGHAPVIPLEA
ncbi:MAG: SDR family oxidoreductase [Chloroflexi bacterium]|nr:SDR family oxidoreductase [Chloroflexota bacterium]